MLDRSSGQVEFPGWKSDVAREEEGEKGEEQVRVIAIMHTVSKLFSRGRYREGYMCVLNAAKTSQVFLDCSSIPCSRCFQSSRSSTAFSLNTPWKCKLQSLKCLCFEMFITYSFYVCKIKTCLVGSLFNCNNPHLYKLITFESQFLFSLCSIKLHIKANWMSD